MFGDNFLVVCDSGSGVVFAQREGKTPPQADDYFYPGNIVRAMTNRVAK
jgi:hypothetical protein